jgi:hypothetical protein
MAISPGVPNMLTDQKIRNRVIRMQKTPEDVTRYLLYYATQDVEDKFGRFSPEAVYFRKQVLEPYCASHGPLFATYNHD